MSGLDTATRLEAGGYSREQAQTLARIFREMTGEVVTRSILQDELQRFARGQVLQEELQRFGRELEQRLVIRFGVMLVVAIGATSTIVHFWH
jgi:hypothetical protein